MADIAFLGTGIMGLPMAQRLQAALPDIAAWNRSSAKMASLQGCGAKLAATPADAADGAAVICLCLSDADAVEETVFGRHGVVGNMAATAMILDFSTIGVAPTRAFAQRLKDAHPDSAWIDAPVSGGVPAAEKGELILFCGGSPDDLERAKPILQAVGRTYTLLGPVGAGQATKLCNQLIVSSNLVAIAEAINLAERLGVDAAILPSALAGGFADSLPLQIFGPRMATRVHQPVLAAVAMMLKDVRAVRSAAADLPLPLLDATRAIYERALAAGLADKDISALVESSSRDAGADLR